MYAFELVWISVQQPSYKITNSNNVNWLSATQQMMVVPRHRLSTVGRRAFPPWSGIPCRTTSAISRTTSPLDSAWKPGFSLATSMLSALETSWQLHYMNSHLPYHAIPHHSTWYTARWWYWRWCLLALVQGAEKKSLKLGLISSLSFLNLQLLGSLGTSTASTCSR